MLLPRVLPAITEGLQDLDDDVRAVAAAALIPVVDGLVQLLPLKVRDSMSPLVFSFHGTAPEHATSCRDAPIHFLFYFI